MDLTRREKIGLIAFSIIVLFFISAIYFNNKKKTEIEVVRNVNSYQPEGKAQPDKISVYICGEVKKPGVYTLNDGDRIEKLISMAGGFTEKADVLRINLAAKLKDEDFIIVHPKAALSENTGEISQSLSAITSDGKININTAGIEDLKKLDGIGDALAQRIIDYRDKNGYFKDIKDIKNVSGIGDSRFKAIEDKITVR
ncbi:helix-hairpin-helix domain-containing protein [Fonticella tunisiensis]|uniref:Competence protein ComEA n=1 Tax=Fonticella tunisiensis TaxID=1096341 RepID=A0A4R7KQ26_9CLOT|nr:helix-hairpin-helix domain-containing protein [Fonticella tunisiensis]TDT61221.1 competence protein ComEA [Fonticella tunisiensis]